MLWCLFYVQFYLLLLDGYMQNQQVISQELGKPAGLSTISQLFLTWKIKLTIDYTLHRA
jgi:hypothetical protein